jgi:hypothetical protein
MANLTPAAIQYARRANGDRARLVLCGRQWRSQQAEENRAGDPRNHVWNGSTTAQW